MKKLLLSVAASMLLAATASVAVAQDIKGGETKAAMCIGCHNIPGYQASFPEVHRVPMISGQSAEYIVAALTAYRRGERRHPTMRAIAGSMSDQDIADLAAFYAQQTDGRKVEMPATPREPSARVAELLNRANCASCHGANYNQPIAPNYPKIAGQHADYLFVALRAYQIDNNPLVGRANPIMSGMARQYTPAELREMAEYLGSLPGDLRVVPQSRFRR